MGIVKRAGKSVGAMVAEERKCAGRGLKESDDMLEGWKKPKKKKKTKKGGK